MVTGCVATSAARGPRDTLAAYAAALDRGDARSAYAYLSEEAQKAVPFGAFERMVTENRDEMKALGQALLRPAHPPLVTATVTTREGRNLLLVLEDGQWRIDGSAIDLYGQQTPEAAVRSFLRAYRNKRFDILLRFVPASAAEGLDSARLRKAWEGEQKAEMDRLTQGIEAALGTARFERMGNRASMSYGVGGTVELLEESGLWKIEDLR
jgi:hypothetical protein